MAAGQCRLKPLKRRRRNHKVWAVVCGGKTRRYAHVAKWGDGWVSYYSDDRRGTIHADGGTSFNSHDSKQEAVDDIVER